MKFPEEIYLKDKEYQKECLSTSPFGKIIKYGTSGFRYHAKYMNYIAFRSAIYLGVMIKKHTNKTYGVVISASHNVYYDNGLKFINVKCEMLKYEEE